jgi:spoIIIJ-associated protein
MEWVETTGKTIDEAKEAALDELGVDEHDAEFEVLEEPKVGLFGRLRSEGRIRARVRPTTPRAKEDRRDRRRRSKGGADSAGESSAETGSGLAPGGATAVAAGGGRSPSRPRRARAAATPAATEPVASAGKEVSEARNPSAEPPRPRTNPSRRRDGRAGSRPAAPGGEEAAPEVPAAVAAGPAPDGPVVRSARTRSRKRAAPAVPAVSNDAGIDAVEGTLMDVALDEQGKVAEQFLAGLLDSFGAEARISVTIPDDDTLDIQVTGTDLGLLIGPKGSTLLAIQDLTRTVVQRRTNAGNGRIFIDVSGYRQRRNEALTRFAHKVAADVVASQTRVAMEPMSAPDRKTVHDAITEIEGVATISEGEDTQRHVVVLPTTD